MSLINLYLEEIRQHLPPKNRDDILNEIRSTLMDMIEDRAKGQSPDDEIIKSVLIEFGPPRKVAQEFGAKNYLIGPQYFPTYLQVLRIVLIVVAAVNVLGLVFTVINTSSAGVTPLEAVLQIVGGLFSSLFTAFGIVTLSFAGIERTTPEELKISLNQEWSPEDLRKHEKQERVSITGLAIEITLSLIFIALLNFFLDRLGIYYLADSRWVSAPILNENINRYIPWVTAVTALNIGLNLYLIRKGFWDKLSVIAKVAFNAFEVAITFAILVGPGIFTVDPAAWQTLATDSTIAAQELTRILNLVFNLLFSLAIFGLVVDSIKRIYVTFIKNRVDKVKFTIE